MLPAQVDRYLGLTQLYLHTVTHSLDILVRFVCWAEVTIRAGDGDTHIVELVSVVEPDGHRLIASLIPARFSSFFNRLLNGSTHTRCSSRMRALTSSRVG